MGNNQFDYTHKQINSLEPVTFKSITSSDLLDYQCNDQGYDMITTTNNPVLEDLFFDHILDQLRDLMPDQTRDLSNDQLLDQLSDQ
jgi:hypothetical protein